MRGQSLYIVALECGALQCIELICCIQEDVRICVLRILTLDFPVRALAGESEDAAAAVRPAANIQSL